MTEKTQLEIDIEGSKKLKPGSSEHYRSYVGPSRQYDFMGLTQIALLFRLGLREENHVLDVGCGSLRAGRFLIQLLMPKRYFGIDPNPWLWKRAKSSEIGADLFDLKCPSFTEDDTFSFSDIGQKFDFIIAQSVFSHAASDIISRPLEQAALVLNSHGQFLFTVLDEQAPKYNVRRKSTQATGWVYPDCITYDEENIVNRCQAMGLSVQRLNWFHPRQSWYRAVLSEKMLLSDDDLEQLGTGKPMFDSRFLPEHPN